MIGGSWAICRSIPVLMRQTVIVIMPFERGTGSPRPALCGDGPASFQSLSNLGRIEDAYVAAKSQKAALEAWGARSNLFASGMAEIVTDPELTREALAHPGKVIRAPRGTPAQHLATAGDARLRPAKSGRKGQDGNSVAPSLVRATPKPKPSRSRLDNATHALEEQRRQFADALSCPPSAPMAQI